MTTAIVVTELGPFSYWETTDFWIDENGEARTSSEPRFVGVPHVYSSIHSAKRAALKLSAYGIPAEVVA